MNRNWSSLSTSSEKTLNQITTGLELLKPLPSARELESEKYLALIASLKGYEEFLLNSDGVIISSNLEIVNITGYEEYEVIGKHLDIFYLVEEKNNASEDLRKATASRRIVLNGMRQKKRGSTFWAKMKIECISDKHPKAFFKVSLQDNTHRTLSKIKTQSFRDEFLTIFNNPFIGTFKYKQLDSRILMCNQKILGITGHNDSGNLYFKNFFSSADQWKQFNYLLDTDKKVEGFQFIIKDDKSTQNNWGLISAHVLENEGFVGGVVMDISENYNQMIELQRVNSELENFTYHASHGLRAPLTTIMGLINLGKNENQVEAMHSYFELIRTRVVHMDTILKDLASISYNGKVEVKSEPFDFKDEIESIINALHTAYPLVEIRCDIVQQFPFNTDAVRMRMILRNMIDNSLKYHNAEAIPSACLKLKVKVKLNYVTLKIQDNGIGIERAYKDKIYDMFFRATTESDGAGLGLYIAKAMLEKIQGTMAVESTPNKGTTFLLTVPNRLISSSNV